MRISIVENGRRIVIPLPTRLLLNSVSLRLIALGLRKYGIQSRRQVTEEREQHNPGKPLWISGALGEGGWLSLMTEENLRALAEEILRAKRIFGNLVLVDVVSSDGTMVKITL